MSLSQYHYTVSKFVERLEGTQGGAPLEKREDRQEGDISSLAL